MDTVELVNQIEEFNALSEFMEDDQLTRALALVVKLLTTPDVPPKKAVNLITELQAMSAKFAILATWYTTIEKGRAGSDEYKKKNVYYTMKESIDKLVDALKYSARMAAYV